MDPNNRWRVKDGENGNENKKKGKELGWSGGMNEMEERGIRKTMR